MAKAKSGSALDRLIRRAQILAIVACVVFVLFWWKIASRNSQRQAQIFDSLVARLEDDNEHVRASAAQALGKLGDQRAGRYLIKLVDDPHVAPVAMDAIDRLGVDVDFSSLNDADREGNFLSNFLEPPRQALRDAIRAADPWVQLVSLVLAAAILFIPLWLVYRWLNRKYHLMERLSAFMQRRFARFPGGADLKRVSYTGLFMFAVVVVYAIYRYYVRPYEVSRDQASALEVSITKIELAGRRKQNSALPMLIRVLSDQEEGVTEEQKEQLKWRAAYAIGQIGRVEGLDALLAHLEDPDRRLRQYCSWAVGNITGLDEYRQNEVVPLVLKFCENCGEPIKADYRYCPNCKHAIDRTFEGDEVPQLPSESDASPGG